MDTVERNKETIVKYIRTQLQKDIMADQLPFMEYLDPDNWQLNAPFVSTNY